MVESFWTKQKHSHELRRVYLQFRFECKTLHSKIGVERIKYKQTLFFFLLNQTYLDEFLLTKYTLYSYKYILCLVISNFRFCTTVTTQWIKCCSLPSRNFGSGLVGSTSIAILTWPCLNRLFHFLIFAKRFDADKCL